MLVGVAIKMNSSINSTTWYKVLADNLVSVFDIVNPLLYFFKMNTRDIQLCSAEVGIYVKALLMSTYMLS